MSAWIAHVRWLAGMYGGLGSTLCFFAYLKTGNPILLMAIVYLTFLLCIVAYLHQIKKNALVIAALDHERLIEEKNVLEESFSKKAKALDMFLHKYADYSKLRGLIDDFASTLSLPKLNSFIVTDTFEVLGKGDFILLYLVDLDENSLSLVASKSVYAKKRTKVKKGDIFDQWVMKNKLQLLVSDITRDVRFDKQRSVFGEEYKSLMVTPIIYESRVVGTLHVDSREADTFTTDDLRILSIIGGIASAALSNAFLYQKTEQLAIKDSLTGLFVHRYFKERLKEEYKRALLTNAPLTLLMTDIDDFKSYNDRYGHAAGDLILKRIGELLFASVKDAGIVARYGGEEFAVLLPKTEKEEGMRIAECIRESIAQEKFELRGVNTSITLSIGVANIPVDSLDSEELIRIADTYLYSAKKKGKNKVLGQ